MVVLANGIDLPIFLGVGLAIILPLLLFNAVVEAPILAKYLNTPWRNLFAPCLKANIWSLLAGLPVALLNDWLAELLLPGEFIARMHSYGTALVVAAINYYLASTFVEFLWFRRLARRDPGNFGRPVLRAFLVANLASYVVLGPLYWYLGQPEGTTREYTGHTRWARQPATELVFLNTNGSLASVRTDGTGFRTLLSNKMVDFVVSADLRSILFRTDANEYYLAVTGAVRRIPLSPASVLGAQMDFSPDGEMAAFGEYNSGRIWVWNAATDHISTGLLPQAADSIRWSTNSRVFYVGAASNTTYEVDLSPSSTVDWQFKSLTTDPPTAAMAQHYGVLGGGGVEFEHGIPKPCFRSVSIHSQNAGFMTLPYMGGGIRAYHGTNRVLILDNVGLTHGGRRDFPEVGFTLSYDELVFHDGSHLYLADMELRKVGRITGGSTFVLLAPMFSKPNAPQLR